MVAIPECDEVQISYTVTSQSNFDDYYIYPVPYYEKVTNPDGTSYWQEVFTKDTAAYNIDEYKPPVAAEIRQTGYMRDQKYAKVFFNPISFNPIEEKIIAIEQIEVTLSFTNPVTDVNVNTGIFNNVAANTFVNYISSGVTAAINDRADTSGEVEWYDLEEQGCASQIVGDYLIITSEPFYTPDDPDSQVLRIAQHRADYNGFDVAIVNVENVMDIFIDPGDGDYKNERAIRRFIKAVYEGENAGNTLDGKLGYVLLVGTVDEDNSGMPTSYDHLWSFPSDYYFSCVTEENGKYDDIGDLFIGRFGVDNNMEDGATQLYNIVEKTIHFETEYVPERKYNVHAMSANQNKEWMEVHFYPYFEDLLHEETLDTVNFWIGDHDEKKYRNDFIQMANNGSKLFIFRGCGEIDRWVVGPIDNDFIKENLGNSKKGPVALSIACSTGKFDDPSKKSMAEELTTYSENKGFVGFLGAAEDWWADPPFQPIPAPPELPNYITATFPYSIFYSLSFVTGEFILQSKLIPAQQMGPQAIYLFNYFGDPALNINAHGSEITKDIILCNATISSEITITEGATVTVRDDCSVHFEGMGKFIVDDGASLVIGDNVSLTRQKETNNITVAGEVDINGYCTSEVEFIINDGGNLTINNNAQLATEAGVVVEPNGELAINNGGRLIINTNGELITAADVVVVPGSELVINDCAILKQIEDAVIAVEDYGKLCVQPDAILDVAGHCAFNFSPNAIIDCVHPHDIVPPTYIITESETQWIGEEYRMVRELEIKPGASLNLENTTLNFIYNDRGVRILPGALLNVNGSELISEVFPCIPDIIWKGIRVAGKPWLPQTEENQGAVILQNNSSIENANLAVKLGSDSEGAPINGGIIEAENTVFRNNLQDVVFYPYQNINGGEETDNISFFADCTFETDDNTIDDYSYHVKMEGVKGIYFTNCTIADIRENISYPEMRKGIYSLSSSFEVSQCDFENLSYGIYATTSDPEKSFRAVDSEFSSHRGIYFNGMDNVRIMDNVFDLHDKPCGSYGVYIDHAYNFQIENNNFYSDEHITRSRFGILANNTGALYKEIYRNDFDGFTVGIEAIGINKGSEPYEGLELRCNRFDNNAYDIFVTDRGIRELQGYPPEGEPCNETLAGNLFGNESPCLVKHFLNEGEFIYYHHHDPISEPRVIPELYNEGSIRLVNYDYEYDYYTSCPIREVNEPMSGLFAGMESSWIQYEETADKLAKLVDDGNTELMVQLVEMTVTPNAYQNYQTLMATSPYLSEKVLTTLSAKEEGFSKVMIRDVLVENPQAAKSKEVNNALDNRKDPLPEYMREQINKGLHYFGEMELLRFQKAYHKTQHDKALNRIISSIVHEDKGWENAPGITTILSDVDDINYRYLLAEFLFSEGDYTQGFEVLSSIEKNYELDEEALAVHNDYLSFYAFQKKLDNEKHPAFTNLPEEALIELETFIGSGNRISGKALSLLMINDAIEYEEPIIYPAKQTGPKTEPHTPQPSDFVAGKDEPFHFNLFPNPCKNYITLSWCSDKEMRGQGIIEIRNSQGVLMHSMKVTGYCDQQIISLYDWKSGSYIAAFRWGSIRKTLPFVVVR